MAGGNTSPALLPQLLRVYVITDAMSTWYARFFAASNFVPPVEWKSEAAQQSLKNIQQYFKPDNAFVWPAEYAADLDAAENVYRAWVYKFISGEASMDQWDQYVAEWKAAGGDKRGRQSAALQVASRDPYPDLDIRSDDHPDPLADLRRLHRISLERYAVFRRFLAGRDSPWGESDRTVIEGAIARDGRPLT